MTDPAVDEFSRRMEQSERDSAAHFWKQFEPAAIAMMALGVTEMRLEPEAFMMLKRSLGVRHAPVAICGEKIHFGCLWIGVST